MSDEVAKALETRTKILIVEDSATQVVRLQRCLESHGYEILVAQTGRQALDILGEHTPALVISDVVMPDIGGYELCKRMKADEALASIPVALVTALSGPMEIVRGLSAGADDFITKPYDDRFLLTRIHSILHTRETSFDPEFGRAIEGFFDSETGATGARREKVFSLIMSSYETAVDQNRELANTNAALGEAHEHLKEQAEQLKILSLRDDLTGLSNRRGFFTLAEQLRKLADRRKQAMVLLFIDVDDLKPINDEFGHEEGDRAIQSTADILRGSVRRSDVVARLGGDEFAALMIDSTGQGVPPVLSRLNAALESRNTNHDARFRLSLSVGSAVYDPVRPCSIEDLMHIADAAMYASKKAKKAKRGTSGDGGR